MANIVVDEELGRPSEGLGVVEVPAPARLKYQAGHTGCLESRMWCEILGGREKDERRPKWALE